MGAEQFLFAIALTLINALITMILVPALKNFFDRISKYEITLANLPNLIKNMVEESINRSLWNMTETIDDLKTRVTQLERNAERDRSSADLRLSSIQKTLQIMEDRAHPGQRRLFPGSGNGVDDSKRD